MFHCVYVTLGGWCIWQSQNVVNEWKNYLVACYGWRVCLKKREKKYISDNCSFAIDRDIVLTWRFLVALMCGGWHWGNIHFSNIKYEI